MLVAIEERQIVLFEESLDRMIAVLSEKENPEQWETEYLNERLIPTRGDRDNFCVEVKLGYYYLSHTFARFHELVKEEFWVFNKQADKMQSRMKAFDEGREYDTDNILFNFSDYGIADNVEQIEAYVKNMAEKTGLDEAEDYIVHMVEYINGVDSFENSKYGPYLGNHEPWENLSDEDPTLLPKVLTFHVLILKK